MKTRRFVAPAIATFAIALGTICGATAATTADAPAVETVVQQQGDQRAVVTWEE